MVEDIPTGVVQHANKRSLRHTPPIKRFVKDQWDLVHYYVCYTTFNTFNTFENEEWNTERLAIGVLLSVKFDS